MNKIKEVASKIISICEEIKEFNIELEKIGQHSSPKQRILNKCRIIGEHLEDIYFLTTNDYDTFFKIISTKNSGNKYSGRKEYIKKYIKTNDDDFLNKLKEVKKYKTKNGGFFWNEGSHGYGPSTEEFLQDSDITTFVEFIESINNLKSILKNNEWIKQAFSHLSPAFNIDLNTTKIPQPSTKTEEKNILKKDILIKEEKIYAPKDKQKKENKEKPVLFKKYYSLNLENTKLWEKIENFEDLSIKERGISLFIVLLISIFFSNSLWLFNEKLIIEKQYKNHFYISQLKSIWNFDIFSNELIENLNILKKLLIANVHFSHTCIEIDELIKQLNRKRTSINNLNYFPLLIQTFYKLIPGESIKETEKYLKKCEISKTVWNLFSLIEKITEYKLFQKKGNKITKILKTAASSNKETEYSQEKMKGNIKKLENFFIHLDGYKKSFDIRKASSKNWRRKMREALKGQNLFNMKYNDFKGNSWFNINTNNWISGEILNLYYNHVQNFRDPMVKKLKYESVIDNIFYINQKYSPASFHKELSNLEIEIFSIYIYIKYILDGFNINAINSWSYSMGVKLYTDIEYIKYCKQLEKIRNELFDSYIKPLNSFLDKFKKKENGWIIHAIFNDLKWIWIHNINDNITWFPPEFESGNKEKFYEYLSDEIIIDLICSKILKIKRDKERKRDSDSNSLKKTFSSSGTWLIRSEYFEEITKKYKPNENEFWNEIINKLNSEDFSKKINEKPILRINEKEFLQKAGRKKEIKELIKNLKQEQDKIIHKLREIEKIL